MNEQKAAYVQPTLVKHELLRDITAGISGFCDRFPGLTQNWKRCN